jgi:tetratricopeptide (TPR) repeat protein
MKKENILFSIIGLLLGFIVGFMFANTTNQRGYATAPGAAAAAGQPGQTGNLPPNHPPVEGMGHNDPSPEAVEAAAKLAKEQPDNFEAQVKAAELFYAAHRYDEAGTYFAAANKLRPEDFDALVGLGNTAFDAGKYADAERWYTAALKQQPDNVNVRTDLGLTFLFREPQDADRAVKEFRGSLERDPSHAPTLQNLTVALTRKGDTTAARETLKRLEAVSPQNPALQRLRAELDKPAAQAPAAPASE